MKQILLGGEKASVLAMGCMRMAKLDEKRAEQLVLTALDEGINLFDHADIYAKGASEELFGRVLSANPGLRDQMLIQTKCGIRAGFYDFSCEHIVTSVEGSLQRLGIETLDFLMLHRPDALAEQEELARAVQQLKQQGKVRHFSVSNMNPAQIRLLESWTGEEFAADQMQLSLMHAGLVTEGINVNVNGDEGTVRSGGLLPFAQQKGMAVQAWSPLQYGMFKGCFLGNDKFPELNRELEKLALRHQVSPAAVALAWILRIPGKMQAVVGTTSPEHLRAAAKAGELTLTRQEWYGLYTACGHSLP